MIMSQSTHQHENTLQQISLERKENDKKRFLRACKGIETGVGMGDALAVLVNPPPSLP